jgi:hypothetical protein
MTIIKWAAAVLVVVLLIAVVAAPIGPMPGILITGTTTEVPNAWGDTQSIEEIQLQIGEGPIGRTVIIWTVQIDGDLYVTGQNDAGWTGGIGPGGPVRMQMAGNLYELTATPLANGQVNVLEAWQAKYVKYNPDLADQFQPPVEAVSTAIVYKLANRS